MRFPTALKGTEPDVIAALKPVAEYFATHHRWPDSFVNDLCDSKSQTDPPPIVLFYFTDYFPGPECCRLYLLLEALIDLDWFMYEQSQAQVNAYFDALVDSQWGILCLLASDSILPRFSRDNSRKIQFFTNLVESFDQFESEEYLFRVPGIPFHQPHHFWNYPSTNLFSVMVEAGVPASLISEESVKQFSPQSIVEMAGKYILD
jgi:hypothetical protein